MLDPINLTGAGLVTKASKVKKIVDTTIKGRNAIAKNLKQMRKAQVGKSSVDMLAKKGAYYTETTGSKVGRVAKSAAVGVPIGYGIMAAKNSGDDRSTVEHKNQENMISGGFVGALNGIIAGFSKGKIRNLIPTGASEAQARASIEAILNDPKQFSLLDSEATQIKTEYAKMKWSTQDPNMPKVEMKPETIFDHPRANEAIEMARTRNASQTYNERVGGDTMSWMDNPTTYTAEPTYHRVGAKGAENYDFGYSLTKADIKKIDSGKITPEIEQKLKDDIDFLEQDPRWKDNKNHKENPDITKQAEEMRTNQRIADIEASNPDGGMSMFANGRGNASGGAMGGGTLGGMEAAYEDIVEGKDLSYQDYLARIAGGAVIGAGLGRKFGDAKGTGMFVGAKPTDKGAFSDVATKQVMREIDDSLSRLTPGSMGVLATRQQAGYTTTLGDLFQHAELFDNYPQIRDIEVVIDHTMGKNTVGGFDPVSSQVFLSPHATDKEAYNTIIHELQHAIQTKEGWAGGGSADEFKLKGPESVYQSFIDKADKERKPLIKKLIKKEITKDEFKTLDKGLESSKEIKKWKDIIFQSKDTFASYERLHGEQQARATEYRMNMTPEQRASESWTDTLKREEFEYQEPIIRFESGKSMSMSDSREILKKYADEALNSNTQREITLGMFSDNAIKRLVEDTGLNLKGYSSILSSSSIRHVKNRHPEDLDLIEEIPNILHNFDMAKKSLTRNKTSGKTDVSIEFYKKMDDGIVKVVELRNLNNKTLEFKTLFRDEADQKLLRELQMSPRYKKKPTPQAIRPKTDSDGFIDNSIPQSPEKLKLGANAGHNMAAGFGMGTANAGNEVYENGYDQERVLEKFIQGMAAGMIGAQGIRMLRKSNPEAFQKLRQYVVDNDVKAGDDLGVKIGAFGGDAPVPNKNTGSIRDHNFDDLERLAREKGNKDWSDILQHNTTAQNIKNSLKSYFTDTFSGKYHDARDLTHVEVSKTEEGIGRLAKVLDTLDEAMDKGLYQYLTKTGGDNITP
ncbi:MAG: hypothetical protein DRG30_07595 [Epsilonproteobacteria bacterium]|nr:MAG: hypothetical protein DRG30_07595 [Campylobacterota bacterium]